MTPERHDTERIPGQTLSADEPISSADADLLDRRRLVDTIAERLLYTPPSQSLAIAINAPWGAGKSSFLNLLHERLTSPTNRSSEATDPNIHRDALGPIVIRFNPWFYGGVEQLIQIFFSDLAREIGADTTDKLRRTISASLADFGPIAASLAASVALPLSIPAQLLALLGTVVRPLKRHLEREKNLIEQKKHLDARLQELPQRIVVFIDDIDRLEPATCKVLFRMVRLNANFKNITYVLAFDRHVVEQHLSDEPVRGRDYLEKIIQASFDIPEPEPQTILTILRNEVNVVLASIATLTLEEDRYASVITNGFSEHFRTIRSIKRYANALRLTLPTIGTEVNLVDFLVIELLRVFHPDVYTEIARSQHFLAPDPLSPASMLAALDDDKRRVQREQQRQWLDELLSHVPSTLRETVRTLLLEIFPELNASKTYGNDTKARWRMDCRVSSPDVFSRHFLLSVPTDKMAEGDLVVFRSELGDIDKVREWFRKARVAGRVRDLLDRQEDFVADLPAEDAANLAQVICDSDPRVDLQLNPDDPLDSYRPASIIFQCIRRQSTAERRYDLFLDLVKEGRFLLTAMRLVDHLHEEKAESGERFPLGGDLRQKLWSAARLRLETAASEDEFWDNDRWYYMLSVWVRLGGEGQAREAVAKFTLSDDQLVTFVETVATSQAQNVVGGRLRRIDKEDLGRWLNVEFTTGRLESIGTRGDELATRATKLQGLLGDENEAANER